MAVAAYLPIVADRYVPLIRHVYLVGLDLRGIDMRAQVRVSGDAPGVPLVDLLTVTNANAQGLRLVNVDLSTGTPVSHVEIVINETTMEGLPFVGEIGDATTLAWDWQLLIAGRKRRLAKGEFEITGDGVTGAEAAPTGRFSATGYPRQPVRDVWNNALLTFGEEQVTVQIDGADLLAPLIQTAAEAASSASEDRTAAQLAAASATASSRYFPTRAAGEAASAVNQNFSTDDGAGSLITYRRTSSGSVEIARTVTPVTLAGYAKVTGAVNFRLDGSRMGITDGDEAIVPQALVNIVNKGSTTNALRVTSYWEGSTAAPYLNNDNSLWETFNRTTSNSGNQSWSISAANAYNDIPAGVVDSGIRYGVFGWATSVAQPGYLHAGTLEQQVGVGGVAGFQETGTPASAVVNNASAIRGVVRADSAGATIGNARAGEFITVAGAGRKLNNFGVYVEASGGIETNWSFFGASGKFFNAEQALFGTVFSQSLARIGVRGGSNALEFGNADPNGYGSNIGGTAASGYPFLAFCAEAEPAGNGYRTRGRPGTVIWNDLSGALVFSRLTNPNGRNLALTDDVILRPDGKMTFLRNPRLLGTKPATATSPGETGEIVADTDFIYVCVADDTWKRAALATW